MRLWSLCIHINTNTGFQFDSDVVISDGGLLAEFLKTEYFIGNFVVGFLALSLLYMMNFRRNIIIVSDSVECKRTCMGEYLRNPKR